MEKIKEIVEKYKKTLFVLAILQLALFGTNIIIPYFNSIFINIISLQNSIRELTKVSFGIMGMGIMSGIIYYFNNMTSAKLCENMVFDISKKALEFIHNMKFDVTIKNEASYLSEKIFSDSAVCVKFLVNNYFTLFLNVFKIIVVLSLLNIIHNAFCLITICIIPVYIISYCLMKNLLNKRYEEYIEKKSAFFKQYCMQVRMTREIKCHATYDDAIFQIKNEYSLYLKKAVKYFKFANLFNISDEIISLLFQFIVLFVGGTFVIQKKMNLGQYTIINTYFKYILDSIKYYFGFGKSYQEQKVALRRIKGIFSLQQDPVGENHIKRVERITVENLGYKYNENVEVFSKINEVFSFGKIYGIIGKNGTGKTTFICTLIGVLREGRRGEIYVNNVNFAELDDKLLRRERISIMLQNEDCMGTVVSDLLDLQNIRKESARWREKRELLDLFCVSKLIYKKMDELSGGERQCVFICRTLMKEADVFILDEPTSQLCENIKSNFYNIIQRIK